MLIVGIAGRKGSGKSTLAYELMGDSRLGKFADILSFAAPIKWICGRVLGFDEDAVYGDDAAKNAVTRYRQLDMPHWCERCCDEEEGERFLTVREVMQQIGTEVFRRMDPDIWVNALFREAARYSPLDTLYIDDVRFANEAEAIRRRGGLVVRLKRGATAGDGHTSEAGIPNRLVDLSVPAGLDAGDAYRLVSDFLLARRQVTDDDGEAD